VIPHLDGEQSLGGSTSPQSPSSVAIAPRLASRSMAFSFLFRAHFAE
jgi:hypothetical protein